MAESEVRQRRVRLSVEPPSLKHIQSNKTDRVSKKRSSGISCVSSQLTISSTATDSDDRPRRRSTVTKTETWSPDALPPMQRSPSGVTHRNIMTRLKSVSEEHNEKYGTLVDTEGSPSPKATGNDLTFRLDNVPEEDSKSSAEMLYLRIEDWGYRRFPVITDHINGLLYCVDLAFRSIRFFQFGLTAVFLGLRLILFAMMILPPLVGCMLMYYHDKRIKRRIRYGPAEREYLDIYIPQEAIDAQHGKGPKVPVVVCIMGGAFIIGHRAYNAQLGLKLMDFGVILVGIDYRNFPRGLIADMVEDVGRGVRWVMQNIEAYGGDRGNMMLMGQSAGAHLSAMLLLEHCLLECEAEKGEEKQRHVERTTTAGGSLSWSVSEFKAYLGVCGPYDLIKLQPHLASRGLYPKIVDKLCGGDLEGCSPEKLVETAEWEAVRDEAASRLPPIHLFHGYEDKAVPVWSSSDFAEKLDIAGVEDVTLDLRRGMSHTYPVILGPMKRHDPQCEIILPILLGDDAVKLLEESSNLPPMWPVKLIDFAGAVCPF